MSVKSRIEEKLTEAFQPESLDIVDESHLPCRPRRQRGRKARRISGSRSFPPPSPGKSRVERHRMVNQVLSEELAGPVHALAVTSERAGGGGRR